MWNMIQSVLMVSYADCNGESGTVADGGRVSFQEHAEFNPTKSSEEAWGGVVYWEHIKL